MKVDIKTQLQTSSFRVKGVDVHPTEPLVVVSLFTGALQLWNYETQTLVRALDVAKLPVRSVKFIPRKNWIVCGSDDTQIRVFYESTLEKVAQFEAHHDYIRCVVAHPTLPLLLTAGDDMVAKLWDWDQDFRCLRTFQGHESYILGLALNPKDPSQFATSSIDGNVRVWSIDSPQSNYLLEAHGRKSINSVAYYPFADKPYLITTSDDRTACIFDYQSKQLVARLEGHTHNVSFAVWHPELPLIVTGSEDSTIKLWNSRSYKLEQTLKFGMERAWCVSSKPNSNLLVVGFETGTLGLRLGRDEPVVSMDANGKLVWTKQLEAYSAAIKPVANLTAGETSAVHVAAKDLGSVEMHPGVLKHSPDGRYVAVCGDGEMVVYTALAWRNKYFTSGTDVCWGPDNELAVITSSGDVHVKRQFKDTYELVQLNARRVFGGPDLLAVVTDDGVIFYEWQSGAQVAVVGVDPHLVEWSGDGNCVALVTDDTTYVLKVDIDAILDGVANGDTELESSFTELAELSREPVKSATWVGDCLIYTTASNRLNYLVGTETYNITHFDNQMFVLRYIARDSAVFLCNKDMRVFAHPLSLPVVEFQTAVLRGDVDMALEDLLPKVPGSEINGIARFLEARGYPELALKATKDDSHRFDLAVLLGNLDLAVSIAGDEEEASKWRTLGDSFLAQWNIDAAAEAYTKAQDFDTLLLIHTSTGNRAALADLAELAVAAGKYNLALSAYWATGDAASIAALLNKSGRHSEAALFSRTYGVPIEATVEQWKLALTAQGREKIAEMITTPACSGSESTGTETGNAAGSSSIEVEPPAFVAPPAGVSAAEVGEIAEKQI